ncbi:MAG: hypothetical protein H8D23_35270 [Candidatus Brocadiales bacterium]|nr:hypothetical protein [Candidatus Brocadiales bacterium]
MSHINSVNGSRHSNRHGSTNMNAYANKNAVATVSDSVKISDKAKKINQASKAEKHGRTDTRELRTHGTKSGQRVEQTSKQISATEKVSHRDSKVENKRYDANMLKEKTENLSKAFKGLEKMGVSAKEVRKIIKTATRNMNEKLGNDLKQAYKDYKGKKISGDEFKSKLYGAAIKKVRGIAKALRNNFMQKPASTENNNESATPTSAKKADSNGSTMAPRQSIFDKKDDVKTASPQESINAKTADKVKDEPTLAEKAIAKNQEKSEEAKAAAQEKLGKISDNAKGDLTKEVTKAHEKTDKVTVSSQEKADSVIAKAEEKAAKELAKAEGKGDDAVAIAQEKAASILAKAASILAKAKEESASILVKADEETEKIADNKTEKTGKIIAKAVDSTEKEVGKAEKKDDDKEVPPGLAKKEEGALPPGLAKKEEGALPPGLEKKEEGNDLSKLEKQLKDLLNDIIEKAEKLPPGLAKKDEVPGNADKAFEEIAGMFDEIDKMVDGLDKEVDGADEKKGFGDFVSGLSDMFRSGSRSQGNSFLKDLHKVADEHGASDAHKVGMQQIKAETLSSMFNGGNTNSSFGINRVGDGGDGSGNFSAVDFMSDMSSNANNRLDSYSDAKDAREVAGEKEADEASGAKQASPEAQFSTLA